MNKIKKIKDDLIEFICFLIALMIYIPFATLILIADKTEEYPRFLVGAYVGNNNFFIIPI